MKNGEKLHHLTAPVLLPVEPYGEPKVYRPPLPVAQIYPMDRLQSKPEPAPKAAPKRTVSRSSMFFKGPNWGIEKDPFLRRLSRLN